MAHFAQLDENNIVTQVITIANNELLLDGIENETKGIMFCKSLFGQDTKWVQTSYNGNIRFNYAGIGFFYDEVENAFISPKPCKHKELQLNELKKWICINNEHKTLA